MKTLKLFTAVVFTAIIGFTSCQSEESSEVGTNPNANSSTSKTASNYERTAMNDGSNDDFLDGNSCTELLFPLTTVVNGQTVRILTSLDFSIVLSILGEFNDDSDIISFNFPLRVRTSTYTEVTLQSQSDLDALKGECENAEAEGNDAISCVKIDFPITMLTYNVSVEQTGSVVIQSQQKLHTFMTDLQSDELFSVNYPMTVTASNGTSIQIASDLEFQSAISECVQTEDEEEQTAENADEVEAILSGTKFKVDSFITGGVEKANEYAAYSIEFTNDLKIVAKNEVNAILEEIEGTYSVSSEIEVFVDISFASNTAVSALRNDFIVTTYSDTVITLKSKTDASVTLAFKKI